MTAAPLAIALALTPLTTQFLAPAGPAQVTVLPVAVALAPALSVMSPKVEG